jgi:ABC-type nickel/cobalt efflux system permease component RcnA
LRPQTRVNQVGISLDISEGGFITAIVLGLVLGLRHATDADHVVAVSTIVAAEGKAFRSAWIGASWGLGHSTPLLIAGTLILFLRDSVLSAYEQIAPYFEFGVAVMLVGLGLQVLWRLKQGRLHLHQHFEGEKPHVHVHSHDKTSTKHDSSSTPHSRMRSYTTLFRPKSFVIGIVHGLAGTAAVMLLLLPEASSIAVGFVYLALFGVGTIVSMMAITLVFSIPLAFSVRFTHVNTGIATLAGIMSVLVGGLLMSDVAVGTHYLAFLPE